jgi:hypothetical protein
MVLVLRQNFIGTDVKGLSAEGNLYDGVTRIHLFLLVPMLAVSLCAAEIDSDPKPGQAVPSLKVKDLTANMRARSWRGSPRCK